MATRRVVICPEILKAILKADRDLRARAEAIPEPEKNREAVAAATSAWEDYDRFTDALDHLAHDEGDPAATLPPIGSLPAGDTVYSLDRRGWRLGFIEYKGSSELTAFSLHLAPSFAPKARPIGCGRRP